MKKIVVGLIIFGSVLLSGCGDKEKKSEIPVSSEIAVESTIENDEEDDLGADISALGDIEVDKNLFSVEFTVPKDFLDEGATEESLTEKAGEGVKSVTLNPDGSATYVMTKAAHKELMDEMTADIEDSLEEMVTSGDNPTYKKIEHNSNFTEITVYVDAEDIGLGDTFQILGFYLYGGMYNAFNGTPVDNINVKYINNNTGEVITDANSSEMGED